MTVKAPEFKIGCNIYTRENYEDGFSQVMSFIARYKKFMGADEYKQLRRYVRTKARNASHHFIEEPTYHGANLLNMVPKHKFVTIDAWVTKGVIGRKKVASVEIDAECMILCECGHCLTRQEARGHDPFVMKPEEFERRAHEARRGFSQDRCSDV